MEKHLKMCLLSPDRTLVLLGGQSHIATKLSSSHHCEKTQNIPERKPNNIH